MYRILFFAALLLIVLLVVWLCDFAFKHLLWRFMQQSQALRVRWISAIIIWSGLGIAFFYGHHYGRFQLEVTQIEITSPRLPASFEGYRIAQISDLHLHSLKSEKGKAFLRETFDRLLSLRPDLIVFTGDLVTYEAQEAEEFRPLLQHLASHNIPVWSIMGNHDYADYTAMTPRQRLADRQQLRRLQSECGWQLLDNASHTIVRGADSIRLIGVENIGDPPFATYGSLAQAMGGELRPKQAPFSILLSHNPAHWRKEVLPLTDIDLTLSGHTHAMQLRLFGWSPVSWRYKEWGGLYTEGPQHLYVNTGIGCTGPAMRLGATPEITLITLHTQGSSKNSPEGYTGATSH